MPFLESVRRAIQQHHLISPGQRVVIGVSGGADSLALMVALHQLRHTLDIDLHIATLDHGWRGEQSAADTQFVVQEAEKRGLSVTVRTLNMSDVTSNLEARGRKARYDFFADVALKVGASVIAVAHHADDQAETVLMRLLRGAGLHGLQGMGWHSPVPFHPHLTLIRPLLGVTRAEVEAFCASEGLQPRHDPTNDDTTFLRNRIRHDVLPQLEKINPNLQHGLIRLADIASVESDYLLEATNKLIRDHSVVQRGSYLFPRSIFTALHEALQRRLIVQLAQAVVSTPQLDVDYDHIIAAVRVAAEGNQGGIAQFTNNVRMRVDYENLIFELDSTVDQPVLSLTTDTQMELPFSVPIQLTSGWVVLDETVHAGYEPLCEFYLPNHKAVRLHMRTRKAGDKIELPGMANHTQKLKDWMINRKITRPHRNNIPLIINGTDIVAVIHITENIVTQSYKLPKDNARQWILSWKI